MSLGYTVIVEAVRDFICARPVQRSVVQGAKASTAAVRIKQAALGLAAVCAAQIPSLAFASTGCNAINSGLLNHSTTFSAGVMTSTTAVDTLSNTDSLQFARSNTTYTDTTLLIDQFAPNNATAYTFDAGDQLSYTATLSGKAGGTTSTLRVYLRNAINGANTTNAFGGSTPSSTLANDGSNSRTFSMAANTTAIGFRINSFNSNGAPSGTVEITASCSSAVSAPTLNSFTLGSVVGYNPGGSAATNVDVAAGGNASNSPTSYAVSNAAGNTFAASSATSGGGTVSINAAGVASYTPRVGYRGTDTFFARAANGGGTSSPAAVTLTVGNPTITAGLTGSGALVGSTLSSYAVAPAGGSAPYSCVLNAGSAALPGGVTLNANCALAGTPTSPGTYSFNVDVTDNSVTGANGGTSSPYAQTNVAVTNFVISQDMPTVSSLAPATGSTAGGTAVVLTGSNFYNVTGVTFGSSAATAFTRNSATQITATSPSGSGAVNVIVATAAGTSPAAMGNQFVFTSPPAAPVVTAPAHGSTASTMPSYQGASDAGVTITIVVDDASIGTTISTGSGVWTKAQPVALASGLHTVRAFATNGLGQNGADSATNTFTVTAAPVASNYTLPVGITYNSGANTATAFTIADRASNSPTSYAVGSATTSNGGTVSINNSGVVTYTAARGYRGNDSFTYAASNAGGTSAPATVTMTVNNPSLSATLAGSGARGIPLSNVRIIPSGGAQPYSCGGTPASGALPAGVSIAGDCSINGTPAQSGSFVFTVNITDSSTPAFTQATANQTLTISSPSLALSPTSGALPGAIAGGAYSQTLVASGGTAPYTYALTAGAPPSGLAFSSGGVLSGVATAAGTYNFTVTATDASSAGSGGPYSVSNSYSLTVAPPTITLTPATLPVATVAASYSTTISSTGGTSTYSYAVTAGALPTGLTLSPDGTLAGTPTMGGSYAFTITSTDSSGGAGPYTGSRSYTLNIAAPTVTITPATLPNAVAGTGYSQAVTAAGGTGSYSYAVTAGALPAGLTLSSTGSLAGTPRGTGTFNFTVTATDGSTGVGGPYSGSRAYTVSVASPSFTLTAPALSSAVGAPYTGNFAAGGGTAPYTYSRSSGAIPPGLTFASNGTLSGTPTTSGTFNFTVIARDNTTGPGAPYGVASGYTFTVGAPSTPVAGSVNAAVAYGSSDNAIALALSGEAATSVAVATPPNHGTASVSGTTITYTPSSGYFGADSFTYTALNTGGSSAPAVVSITVATPPAPAAADESGLNVPYASTGTAIDLSRSISGVHSSIAVSSAPTHGNASVSGDVVTYSPTAGYFGADSFTYTATGPGGMSTPATVSLTVSAPAAPAAASVAAVAVPYNGSGTIDVTSSITGVYGSLSVASAPARGAVSVSGNVFTYTASAGYYGADSFTYTATGPGGTSAPATISVDVSTPANPVASNLSSVAVSYNSAGTLIDLAGAITGVHTSVSIATSAAHGAATIAGDTVTYMPAPGYFGPDSFTYIASGPGGASSAATVTLQVAVPPAPVAVSRSEIGVPYNGAGAIIDLARDISGLYTGVAIATTPTNGTATIAGTVATYTPNTGYFGADRFTYAVSGPGGTSTPVIVELNVAAPPPPTVTHSSAVVAGSTTTTAMKSVAVDLSALVKGEYDRIQIESQPAHGTVTLRSPIAGSGKITTLAVPRVTATYTPDAGFTGTDMFTFVAVGPGGTSALASVSVEVVGTLPVALPKTAQIGDGQTVSVLLTEGASGGPFTAATIVSVTPADQATASIVASGSGASQAYRLDVSPAARFGGDVVITYTLSNAYGTSAPSTLTVSVAARPDPSADANVRAISDAQAETARRFARGQVTNFMRRTEQLHGRGNGSGGARMGVTLASRDGRGQYRNSPTDPLEREIAGRMRPSPVDADLNRSGSGRNGRYAVSPEGIRSSAAVTETGAAERDAGGTAGEAQQFVEDAEEDGDGTRRKGSLGIWTGGSIDVGTQNPTTDRSKITATTSGLSAGIDVKMAEGVTVGLGGGYGNDITRIAGRAARVRSDTSLVAAYVSLTPLESLFIDGMVGRGDLGFRTRRFIAEADAPALGSRDGSYTVGALAFGIDRQSEDLSWSFYGRGDLLDAKLGAYAESGSSRYDLRFDERSLSSIAGTLGARLELRQRYDFGLMIPRIRGEWSHEFANADAQRLDFADIVGAAFYGIGTEGWSRDQFQLGFGGRIVLPSLWAFDVETALRGASGQRSGTLRLQLSKEF